MPLSLDTSVSFHPFIAVHLFNHTKAQVLEPCLIPNIRSRKDSPHHPECANSGLMCMNDISHTNHGE